MNGEWIMDALNDLDEDLIAQTQEVRQGKRKLYRPPVRGIIAAAACAAIVLTAVLSVPPRIESDSAAFEPMENGMEVSGDSAGGALKEEYGYSTTSGQWKTVTAGGITVNIPSDWEWAKLDTNGDWGDHIALSHGDNHLIIGYYHNFAVCGTGLEQKNVTIAGMEARVGTYDGKNMWDFIVFPGDYVVLNESGENWTEDERTAIISILESLEIEKEGVK